MIVETVLAVQYVNNEYCGWDGVAVLEQYGCVREICKRDNGLKCTVMRDRVNFAI